VSASTAGWVRLYAALLDPRYSRYAEYAFPGAHGLHWDPHSGLLWALGDNDLVALAPDRDPFHPQLTEVNRYPLPGAGPRPGHP
jgi:hypothetical protein